MQKIAKSAIVLITSTIGSWIGAVMDHGNWFGWTSSILGVIGLVAGYLIARGLDNYING